MSLRPTLYSARWLLPVSGAPLRDAGMLVDADGRIERVAPTASFEPSEAIARVDLGEAAILPGLVNVHAHPELAVFRGLLEDLPFDTWISTLMRCKQGARLTIDDYDVAARWTCVESLRAGITTIGATEDTGVAVKAFGDAGVRGLVFLEVFGPAPDQAAGALAGLRVKLDALASCGGALVRVGVSPHAAYTVSDALYAAVARYASAEQLPVATHAAEAEAEDLLVREAAGPFAAGLRSRGIAVAPRGRSVIEMLARNGILDCAPLLIHAIRLAPNDIAAIAAAGATIAHCPIANARLGHGIAPIVEVMEKGITVGIGTDSVASNNRLDLLEEARVAHALQRARLQNATALSASELLRMVTIEGARVLGLEAQIGTLSAGKSADFCAISFANANSIPVVDPVASLFHSARGSDVILTTVAGRPLFRDGIVITLDEPALRDQMNAIGSRLSIARSASW